MTELDDVKKLKEYLNAIDDADYDKINAILSEVNEFDDKYKEMKDKVIDACNKRVEQLGVFTENRSSLNIYQKLLYIQYNLKCPKDKEVSYGKTGYKYRSTEDIFSKLKPLCEQFGIFISFTEQLKIENNTTTVEVVLKAVDVDNPVHTTETNGHAVVDLKSSMNASQKIGSAISYAKKYALGSMFAIDDSKDIDAGDSTVKKNKPEPVIDKTQLAFIKKGMAERNIDDDSMMRWAGVDKLENTPVFKYKQLLAKWQSKTVVKTQPQTQPDEGLFND